MSLLTIIQSVAKRVALESPDTVIGNTNTDVVQLLEMANEEVFDLSERHNWQVNTKEFTHLTTATQTQGSVGAVFGSDYHHLLNETLWDRTNNRPLFSLDTKRWQELKSGNTAGPYVDLLVRGNQVHAIPDPSTATTTWAGFYQADTYVLSSAGSALTEFENDTDTTLLREDLIKLGIIWRYKSFHGFDYSEEFRTYESRVAKAISDDTPKQFVNLSGPSRRRTGANVPEASWPIS